MAKTALITGASSGIGREIAKLLSQRGFRVILAARREDRLTELAEQLGTDSRVIVCDLSKREECYRLYDEVKDEKITVLVNNAGFGRLGEFTQIPLDDELKMIDTNIVSLHILTKLFLKDLVEADRGYILNVASSAGLTPGGPMMAAYYATKAYVVSLTGAIYEELQRSGSKVSVSALCPGPVDTEFNKVAEADLTFAAISAGQCAKAAVEGMFMKKLTIVPDIRIKAVTKLSAFAPRKLSLALTGQLQANKKLEP